MNARHGYAKVRLFWMVLALFVCLVVLPAGLHMRSQDRNLADRLPLELARRLEPHAAMADSVPQTYSWANYWEVEPRPFVPEPWMLAESMAPFEIALADDGRVYVADVDARVALEFLPDGRIGDLIRADDLPPEFKIEECGAGTVLGSLALDNGGIDDAREERLYLNWHCLSVPSGGASGFDVTRTALEVRPGGDAIGRSLRQWAHTEPRTLISIDQGTGHLFFPYMGNFVWLDPDLGRQILRTHSRAIIRTKAVGRHDPVSPSYIQVVPMVQQAQIVGTTGELIAFLNTGEDAALAVDATVDGPIYVLSRPFRDLDGRIPNDSSRALVHVFDESGQIVRSWSGVELGVPHPPDLDWPWQIAASEAGFALTTAIGGRHAVVVFDPEGRETYRVLGQEAQSSFDLYAPPPSHEGLRIDTGLTGNILLLDRANAAVWEWDSTGGFVAASIAPPTAIDVASTVGRRYVSTLGRQIFDAPSGQRLRSVVPADYSVRHGEMGGRIAAGDDRLYVAWHHRRRVGVIDPASASIQTTLSVSDTIGLWPADVTAGPDGALYTANVAAGRIERWSTAVTPTIESRFKVGLLQGPWRISHGRLANGLEGIAALTLEGNIELHEARSGALIARFEPRLPDGSVLDATDIALGERGQVYVVVDGERYVHRFEPAGPAPTASPSPTPDPAASATPTPERRCLMEGDKRVTGPERIVLGQTTEIQLTLRADCPPRSTVVGADIVIVIDRSGSMQGINFVGVKNAVQALLQFVDTRHHRVALASFSDSGRLDHPLSHDTAALYPVVDALVQGGGTRAEAGIEVADLHLLKNGRPDSQPFIIFLSDGRFNDDPSLAAAEARGRGVQVFSVGYGSDINRENMLLVAGVESRYREAPDAGALIRIYQGLIREVQSTIAGSLIIDDLMGPRIEYVPGSARPAALQQDDALQWGLPILPRSGVTLTYTIKPDSVGILPTNLWASARLRADGGINETFTFPIPEIEVIAPSPTPTATPTNTPTPSIFEAYLPLILRERCDPSTLANDVVLVLDASTSMLAQSADGRSKMDAAKDAVRLFLGLLDLEDAGGGRSGAPGIDRAAIVSFNAEARLAHGLSRDRNALTSALSRIENASTTRIDLGIAAAVAELEGERNRSDAGRIIVLLTDGRANPVPISVAEQRAAEAKAKGMTLYTIGLGSEVEAAALERIASQPSNYFAAAGPEALDAIYDQIARTLPCPKDTFWSRR